MYKNISMFENVPKYLPSWLIWDPGSPGRIFFYFNFSLIILDKRNVWFAVEFINRILTTSLLNNIV